MQQQKGDMLKLQLTYNKVMFNSSTSNAYYSNNQRCIVTKQNFCNTSKDVNNNNNAYNNYHNSNNINVAK